MSGTFWFLMGGALSTAVVGILAMLAAGAEADEAAQRHADVDALARSSVRATRVTVTIPIDGDEHSTTQFIG